MRVKRWIAVSGTAVVLVAGAGGAALAASSSSGTKPPAEQTAGDKAGTAGKGGKAMKPAPGAKTPLLGDKAIALLASQLGVSPAEARKVAGEIERLVAEKGSIEPGDPAFAKIAAGAGTTPQGLAAALDAVKRAVL